MEFQFSLNLAGSFIVPGCSNTPLGAAPFAAFGFIRFQGMYTEDIVKMARSSFMLSTRNLINVPFNLYCEILEPFINQSRKESIVHDKKLRKIEKAQQRKNKSA